MVSNLIERRVLGAQCPEQNRLQISFLVGGDSLQFLPLPTRHPHRNLNRLEILRGAAWLRSFG